MRTLITVLVLIATSASAQWQLVAPNAIPVNNVCTDQWGGTIINVEDVLWAGNKDLRMSTDLGVTWQVRTPPFFSTTDFITSISFFNKQIGILATYGGALYHTLDGGMNWQELNHFTGVYCTAFMGSPDRFAYSDFNGSVYTTTDGGASWNGTGLAYFVPALTSGKGGALYAIAGQYQSRRANLFKTMDYGQSWTEQPGLFDWDSWSFAIDNCDSSVFYAANEDVALTTDNKSCVYVSKDEGMTWIAKDVHRIKYHCGSVTVGGKAIFTQTKTGITRSIDHGDTWKEIGGPPNTTDTRLVTALTENVIFAVDENGSVWRTFNSGGDSVSIRDSIFFFPDTLFSQTDIFICDDSAATSLHFAYSGCEVKQIASASIEGSDSNAYRILSTSADSISSLFTPSNNRNYSATLVVTLSDGSIHRVPMGGRGVLRPGVSAELTLPKTFHTDTIGGLISVPIIIKGLDKPRDVEMTLHFDKGLVYTNTSLGAKTFDVAGTLTNTSVRIFIGAADINLGAVSAYANFTIFPDPLSSWNVSFDSISVPSLQCQSITNSYSATITGLKGCGIGTLTRYVRTGRITLSSIIPNPTRGGIDVTFSLPADDGVSFELVDSRGIILRSLAYAPMTKGMHTLHFDLTRESAGNYFVKMVTGSGEELTQKCIISK